METRKITYKISFCLLIALFLLCFMSGTVLAADFSDMPDNWSTAALTHAVNNGLLTGSDGKINADGALTRAEMAAIINRAFAAVKSADITFSDVAKDAWYAQDVAKAVQMQTFAGYADKTFQPNAAITRQEAFVVIARAFRISGENDAALAGFSDSANIGSWAKASVAGLVKAGYISGNDGKLYPKEKISRAEFAQIMDNMVAQYIKTPGTVTSVEKGNIIVNCADVVLENTTISGDLIIADGVGDGDCTLKNVKITGKMIVRGGGTNSIVITGTSSIGKVVISRVDGAVRVVSQDGTEIPYVTVDDGKNGVILEGQFDSLEVASGDVPVTIQGAQVGSVTVAAANANITVDQASTVSSVLVASSAASATVNVSGTVNAVKTEASQTQIVASKTAKITTVEATATAKGTQIATSQGSTITTVTTAAANTTITGSGSVSNVSANADNINVSTPGTQVSAAPGTTGVTAGGSTVEGGTTGQVPESSTSSSSSGGSSVTMRGIKITVSNTNNKTPEVMNMSCQGSDVFLDMLDAYFKNANNAAVVNRIVDNANRLMTSIGSTSYNNKWTEFRSIMITGGQVTGTLADALDPGFATADAAYVHGLAANIKTALAGTTVEGKTAVLSAIGSAVNFNASSKAFAQNVVEKLWGNNDATVNEFFTGAFASGATVTTQGYTLKIEKWIQ